MSTPSWTATWSAWFDGLDVSGDEHGQTTIAGPVVDQAAGTAC